MHRPFDVRWHGDVPATPEETWEALTLRTSAWLWEIAYEPRVGGAETGLTGRGTVTRWDPPSSLATRAELDEGPNQLTWDLAAVDAGTAVAFRHQGTAPAASYDVDVDACQAHTDLYYHSLREYLTHFAPRPAVHVSADGPAHSADGGGDAVRAALGVPCGTPVGTRVAFPVPGLGTVHGTVDYEQPSFVGIRTRDALLRFCLRDTWGWPVGLAHHCYEGPGNAPGPEALAAAWQDWLAGACSR